MVLISNHHSHTGYILFVVFVISTAKLRENSLKKYEIRFLHPLEYSAFANIFPLLSMPNIFKPLLIYAFDGRSFKS